jgi:hypothetical protein
VPVGLLAVAIIAVIIVGFLLYLLKGSTPK